MAKNSENFMCALFATSQAFAVCVCGSVLQYVFLDCLYVNVKMGFWKRCNLLVFLLSYQNLFFNWSSLTLKTRKIIKCFKVRINALLFL